MRHWIYGSSPLRCNSNLHLCLQEIVVWLKLSPFPISTVFETNQSNIPIQSSLRSWWQQVFVVIICVFVFRCSGITWYLLNPVQDFLTRSLSMCVCGSYRHGEDMIVTPFAQVSSIYTCTSTQCWFCETRSNVSCEIFLCMYFIYIWTSQTINLV